MTEPSVYDHYRVDGGGGVADDPAPGVYRVVGLDDEQVTLLRVADGDGSRVHAGRVEQVPLERLGSSFQPARNPDDGFHPVRSVLGMVDGLWWELRSLLRL